MGKLTEISKEWKRKADLLLEQKGMIETLSKFGKVNFNGAYAYDLMMHGDIDISISRKQAFSIEEVFEIFRQLYFGRKFRSYFIGGDWDDPRKGKEFPKGYYIGLKERINEERWKIDIWFVSESEQANRNENSNLYTVTENQKDLILECKQYRNDHKLSVIGQEIYDNVLSGKWKSIKDFKTAIKV